MNKPSKVALAFHGSNESNFPSILRSGLLVPGQNSKKRIYYIFIFYKILDDIKHATDVGYWGKGIYLSPDPVRNSLEFLLVN